MTLTQLEKEADRLRDLVLARIGVSAPELKCPREKSAYTPCVARDGALAMADAGVCVGCSRGVTRLLEEERLKPSR
jgi:hypothetical protein